MSLPRVGAEAADTGTADELRNSYLLVTADVCDCRLILKANMADNAIYRALRLYVLFFTGGSSSVSFLCKFPCGRLNPHFFCFFSHIAPDKFYVEPRDQQSVGDQILEIDRVTQELSLAGKKKPVSY